MIGQRWPGRQRHRGHAVHDRLHAAPGHDHSGQSADEYATEDRIADDPADHGGADLDRRPGSGAQLRAAADRKTDRTAAGARRSAGGAANR